MNRFSILLCIVAAIAAVSATDYCTICPSPYKHIACDHSGQFDASCPADAQMVPITNDMKQVLVDAHNEKRNLISGGGEPKLSPACHMATMEWDDELAYSAALNVMQCQIKHDECHSTDAFLYSGQNLARLGFNASALDHAEKWKEAVNAWFSEKEFTSQRDINKYPENEPEHDIGHFTVMMADRNIRVGCAAATYKEADSWYPFYLLACNYATMNMAGFPIYESCNQPAASCTTGTNPQYPNLCSASEQYDVNKWY